MAFLKGTREMALTQSTKTRRSALFRMIWNQKIMLALTIPIIIYIFIFNYLPLGWWAWAFFDYKPKIGLLDANFAGFHYFKELFSSEGFWIALRNTLVMSLLNLSAGTLISIIFSLMINEMHFIKFKRIAQTVSYLPHFISWVVVASIFTNLFRIDGGVINDLLINLGLIEKPIHFLLTGSLYWPLITFMGIWKETGWSAILYLSAMTGINEELYEAAYVDGAGRLRKIWHVTLPGIKGTIIILLIMNAGWVLGTGFEQGLLFSNGANMAFSDVIPTYTVRYGLSMGRISFATAATIFQSLTGFGLVLSANYLSRKVSDTSLF
jgi:putative aldouronate transport system permease protein